MTVMPVMSGYEHLTTTVYSDPYRTRCQGPDVCVHLDSLENTAKIANVCVIAPPVCTEGSVWRRMKEQSPATAPLDILETSVRLENLI